jgi:NAD(P)-dependent dehydrogenase (short-subunit alcohol dehydrogenase family)
MKIFELSGKIAIVTGGNQGIGFEIARGLASAGATVVIANRREAEGQRAAGKLKKEGLHAIAIPVNVSDISSIKALVTRVVKDFGGIDILVNNAGITRRNPAEDVPEEDWDLIMNTNLKGLYFCSQLAGREMIKRKKGRIINLSTFRIHKIAANRSVYALSKAGVSFLTRALAFEWAKYNINVNAIAPGITMTDFNRGYFEEYPEELEMFKKSIVKGRLGIPADYAGAAIFLASDASDYMTGQTLFIDGGATLG